MGAVYMKDKPEADSFSYAYVEDAEGKLVRIAVEKMKEALGIGALTTANITLSTANWIVSDDRTYYTQTVSIDGITSNSKVDLQPTPEQIIQLMNEEVTLFIANNEGTITAYAVNNTPSADMTFEVTITEVV